MSVAVVQWKPSADTKRNLAASCNDRTISVNLISPSWELFDGQAAVFEDRAGLPADLSRDIASAVLDIGAAGNDDLIVEIGPGTGQIGEWLGPPMRYIGMDYSAGMLREFHRRLRGVPPGNRLLIQVDANATWPIDDRVARVVFSSRALHLLEHEHVASEVFRIARPPEATLIIGRVQRDHNSIRTRMAREMIERLRSHGFEGRRGEQQNRKLVESCRRRGAKIADPVSVAAWRVSTSPRQSVDSWRCLKGLGGIPVPTKIRHEILAELETWAEEEFGGLDQQMESEETYVLQALRVPGT